MVRSNLHMRFAIGERQTQCYQWQQCFPIHALSFMKQLCYMPFLLEAQEQESHNS